MIVGSIKYKAPASRGIVLPFVEYAAQNFNLYFKHCLISKSFAKKYPARFAIKKRKGFACALFKKLVGADRLELSTPCV